MHAHKQETIIFNEASKYFNQGESFIINIRTAATWIFLYSWHSWYKPACMEKYRTHSLFLGGLMVMLLIQSMSLVVAIVVFSLGQLPCPSSRSGVLWMPTIILSFMFSFLLICQRLFRLVFPLYVLITFHPCSMARKHSRRFNTGVVYWYKACFYTPYHCSVCMR